MYSVDNSKREQGEYLLKRRASLKKYYGLYEISNINVSEELVKPLELLGQNNSRYGGFSLEYSSKFLMALKGMSVLHISLLYSEMNEIKGVNFCFLKGETAYSQYPGICYKDSRDTFFGVMESSRYFLPKEVKTLNWGGGSEGYKVSRGASLEGQYIGLGTSLLTNWNAAILSLLCKVSNAAARYAFNLK